MPGTVPGILPRGRVGATCKEDCRTRFRAHRRSASDTAPRQEFCRNALQCVSPATIGSGRGSAASACLLPLILSGDRTWRATKLAREWKVFFKTTGAEYGISDY